MLSCLPDHVVVILRVEVLPAPISVVVVDPVVHQVTAVVVHLLPFPRVDAVAARTVHLGVDGEQPAGVAGDAVPVAPDLLLLSQTTEIYLSDKRPKSSNATTNIQIFIFTTEVCGITIL